MNRRLVFGVFALGILCVRIPMAAAQAPQSGMQTFTGIPTFLSAPYQPDLSKVEADIAVIGVPFDEGTWGWPGERYGARAMREATQDYKQYNLRDGFYLLDEDRYILKGKRWVDTGDVEVPPTVPRQTFENLTNAIRAVQARGAFPLVLGGDHSITTASIKAHPEPLTIIHFDAHLDTWTSSPGNVDHSSPIRRAAEELPNVKKIIQVGMRGLANDIEAVSNARKIGSVIITSERIHKNGVEWALAQIQPTENIYVTMDVDVMDPSVTPGTGTYEPGGLSFLQMDDLLKGVAKKGHLVGFDVVEVNPMRDPSGRTAQTAVRLILDFLGEALK